MRQLYPVFALCLLAAEHAQAQPGSNCANAVPVTEGVYTASADNYWYSFVPDSTGVFFLHTCGLSTCDTKLWVYDHCTGLTVNEGWLNAIAYNDDACGLQTQIQVILTAGTTYYIRVGDYNDVCVNVGEQVEWEIFIPEPPPPPSCTSAQSEMMVVIVPDAYPAEIHWSVTNGSGDSLGWGGANSLAFCVDTGECTVFTITDDYGDGINPPGGYWLYLDGALVTWNDDFGELERLEMNCPTGFSCTQADTVTTGPWTAPGDDYWYVFVPDSNGLYQITTCGSTCDTRIWVYDHCTGLIFDETNIGTTYFDDNSGGCGLQALLEVSLEGGVPVWIRIGDSNDDCGGGPVAWELNYLGPVSGCTDIGACNFNPLAEVDDGSCIAWGDPNCPNGPDLVCDQTELQNTIALSSVTVSLGDCYISEGCLSGYGSRELIRFSTRVENIGQADYYIGSPGANPDQFVYSACHNHWHYQGYAEYLLFDTAGQEVTEGYKNGFCVLDLDCSGGGTAQYGCSNMGISAGCADIYGSGLACQWIDITSVPEGLYTLVVRVNWDNSPDALGHYEMNHTNNWAQACVFIDRTPTLSVTLETDCDPYIDCTGEIYGSAQIDCEGVCDGSRLVGDLDVDQDRDLVDAQGYVSGIIAGTIDPLLCNDANSDGDITVTDAALVNRCNLAQIAGDSAVIDLQCDLALPEIINIYDSVTFTIGAVDMVGNTLDIWLRNPNHRTLGYELLMSGLEITGVDNLADPVDYPITPAFAAGGTRIVGLSYEDSTVARSSSFHPLCRVHFTNPDPLICISEVVDVVNENYENSLWFLEAECVTSTGLGALAMANGVMVYPNPFTDETVIYFPVGTNVDITVNDLQGRTAWEKHHVGNGRCAIKGAWLAPGTYIYRLSGGVNATGRLVVE